MSTEDSTFKRLGDVLDRFIAAGDGIHRVAEQTRAMSAKDTLIARLEAEVATLRSAFAGARDCLLNLVADAKRFDEDVDGDEVNGRAVVYIAYHITTDESQLRDLAEALGIRLGWNETVGDALKRVIEADTTTT